MAGKLVPLGLDLYQPRDGRLASPMRQKIDIIRSRDGVRLACAQSGTGPPLVRAATWMTHAEYDWHGPVWRHWLRFLSSRHRLIRYDQRGVGLSDRNPGNVSFEDCVTDLESVVDALDLQRFPLFGMSQGAAVAVEYTARHPERVERLLLYGGFPLGWHEAPNDLRRLWAALQELAALGWEVEHCAFREIYGRLFAPESDAGQREWFADVAQKTTSGETAARTIDMLGRVNVLRRLREVRCPTLVIHPERDAVIPLEAGRTLADGIPGAELAILDSCNHILLEHEPAWQRFQSLVNGFLPAAADPPCPLPDGEHLTRRQQDVLALLAEGLSNHEIAERLGIGEKTVRNHVSIILDKLGVHSRARAIVLAQHHPQQSRS